MRLTHVHIYTYVRLTHIVLLYNQSDGLRLSEHLSLVICYFNTIFFIYKLITIVTRYCVATIYYALSLFTLYYNYVSYFVVKCDLALLLLRQGTCNVI